MTLIDANVILRYLLNDDEGMAQRAAAVIAGGAFTTTEVIAEVVYVLSGKLYRAKREEIGEWLTRLLSEIQIENKPVVLYALRAYAETSLDFVDCVLVGYRRVLGLPVFSFDKKLNRLLEAE